MSATGVENGGRLRGMLPLLAVRVSPAVVGMVLWLVVAAMLLIPPLWQTQLEIRAGVVRPLSTQSFRVFALQGCRHRALQQLNRVGEYAAAGGGGRVVDLGNGRVRVETQLPSDGAKPATAVTCVVTGTAARFNPENPSGGWIFERLSVAP